jgi:2-keto-4-pentenoate hydratase/2-oxohepta-3-ene-1,7-dioic acid hydratase in catechol pathway
MSDYQHSLGGDAIDLPVGKVVCVGRNYLDHIRELNNDIPEAPLLFIKPSTAVVAIDRPISIPLDRGEVHHELEIALLIGQRLSQAGAEEALQSITGVGLGLDLTLRDVQSALKKQGQPWEVAKAFDGSCPLTPFVPVAEFANLQKMQFSLHKNSRLQQDGLAAMMIHKIADLLSVMSQSFTLLPGDVVLTGTPAGVSALSSGDQLELSLDGRYQWSISVV